MAAWGYTLPAVSFTGIPDDLRAYLADLDDNNDRDWFNKHKARYTSSWLAPGVAFVEAISPRLAAMEPPISGEPRVNGSIWRIQRDTRFSKDKTPYKTHLAFRFWYGPNKKASAGFYLGIGIDDAHVGVGLHGMDKHMLARYRDAVAGPEGEVFAAHVAAAEADGFEVKGEATKRVPRGYDADHPRGELLKYKGIWVSRALPEPVTGTPDLLDHAVEAFEASAPVAEWLQTHVVAG